MFSICSGECKKTASCLTTLEPFFLFLTPLFDMDKRGLRGYFWFFTTPSQGVELGEGMRGNDLALCQGRFRLDTRRNFFTEMMVRHWKRLPGEALGLAGLGDG